MFTQRSPFLALAKGIPALGLLLLHPLLAEDPSIVQSSPFLPPNFKAPNSGSSPLPSSKTGNPTTDYQFKGFYQLNGEYHFLVAEPRSRKSYWVSVGDTAADFELRSFNAETPSITLFFNNQLETIPLAKLDPNPTPRVVQSTPTAAARPRPRPNPDPRATRPGQNNSDSSVSQRRAPPPTPEWLKKIREEARRRRDSGESPSLQLPADLPDPGPPPDIDPSNIPDPPDFIPQLPPEVLERLPPSVRLPRPSGPPSQSP